MSSNKTTYLINSPFGPPIVTTTASSALYNVIKPTYDYYNNYITINEKESNYGLYLSNENTNQKNYFDKYLDAFNDSAAPLSLDSSDSAILVLEIPTTADDVEDLLTKDKENNATEFKNYNENNGNIDWKNGINKSAIIFKQAELEIKDNIINDKLSDNKFEDIYDYIYFEIIKLNKNSSDLYNISTEAKKFTMYNVYVNSSTNDGNAMTITFGETNSKNRYMSINYKYNPSIGVNFIGMNLNRPTFVGSKDNKKK